MATISEYLSILIGIDTKKLKSDAEKAKKEVSGVGAKIDELKKKTLDFTKNGLGQLFTALAGSAAFGAFIANVVGADAALNRLSKTTGMSVESLSAWGNAAEHMGGSASEMQAGIAGMSKELTKFKYTGDSTLIPFLNQMGVNILDNNGKMKDQSQIMLELADQAQKMPKEDFANLAGMNGFNQSQINLMLQGRKALEAQLKEQNKNAIVTKQQAEEAQKAEQAWVDLKQSFMGVARAVAYVVIPPLIVVAKVLTAMFTYMGNHKETLGVLFLFAIPKLLAFNKGFLILLRAMTGITPILKLATFAMRGFGLSTLIALAPLLLIGTGLGLLLDDFLTFQAGGDSWIPWGKIFGGGEGAITTVKELMANLVGLKDVMGDIAKGDFATAKQKVVDALHTPSMDAIDKKAGEINENLKEYGKNALTTAGKVLTGFGAFRFGGGVDEHIHEASQRYGMGEDVLRGFVKMEGGWKGAMSPTGAIGTGQFTKGTWNELAKTAEGQRIGMTMINSSNFRKSNDPRYNKRVNTLATALLAHENAKILQRNGLPVTGENLYMMHNIGPGVIPALKGQGASSATLLAMRQNGMKAGMSASDFVRYQKGRFNAQYNIANKGASFTNTGAILQDTGYTPHTSSILHREAHKHKGIKANNKVVNLGMGESPFLLFGDSKTIHAKKVQKPKIKSKKHHGDTSLINLGMGDSPFITPTGAKAHHALKHGHKTVHNHITSSTVIHKMEVVGHGAEDTAKKVMHKLQKSKELNNSWWKAAQYNNSAMT